MKRKTILIAVLAFCFLACKKTNDGTSPRQTQNVLKKDLSLPDQRAFGTPTDIEIGRYSYTTDNSGIPLQFYDAYTGTVPDINFYDVKIVFSDGADSVEFSDPAIGEGWWSDTVSVRNNTTYRISVYVSVSMPTIGTLTSNLKVAQGANKISQLEMGQTTTFRYYKVAPVFTGPTPVTTVTTNGSDVSLGAITIAAPDGAIASKAFAYRLVFADNGVKDTIVLDSLRFYKNGTNVTDKVTLMDSLGNQITKLSSIVTSNNKLYIRFTSGTGEAVTQKGTTDKFEARATVRGIGSPADGDAIRITQVIDDVLPTNGERYPIVKGNDYRPRLGVSPRSTDGILVNYEWSDMSETPHVAYFGTASGDWHNGAGLTASITSIVYHSRVATGLSRRHPARLL